jgi:hypothetical protein
MAKQGRDFQQYLAQLDQLLKKNQGQGLFVGQDVAPGQIIREGRRVFNPTGLEMSRAPIAQQPQQQSAPQIQSLPQVPSTDSGTPGWQRSGFEQSYANPEYKQAIESPNLSSEQLQQGFEQSGRAYGVMSMADGGVLYNDGLIRYDDGTVREYTGQQDAYAFRSNADGSVGYSDGSSRRQATEQEQQVQQGRPTPIASMEGGRVMYSDGIIREFNPATAQTTAQPQAEVAGPESEGSSGVVNFYDKYGQGYKFNAGPNDLLGECAWFSQQITTLEDGSSWRIGNTIGQKKQNLANHRANGNAFYKGEQEPTVGNSIVFDEGTTWGHVGTIAEIFKGQDGKTYYRITESNYAKPKTVTHDRVITADDRKIVGFVKSKARDGYELKDYTEAPEVTGERDLGVADNASITGEQEREGGDNELDMEAQLPPISSDQTGGKYSNLMSSATGQPKQPQQQFLNNNPVGEYQSPAKEAAGSLANNVFKSALQANPLTGTAKKVIETTKPTGKADFGVTEGLITPDAAQARMQAAKDIAKPTEGRNIFGQVQQKLGNAADTLGTKLNIPETGISEIIAQGPTSNTSSPFSTELKQAAVDNVKQAGQSLNSLNPFSQSVGNIQKEVQSLGSKASQAKDVALSTAGKGIEGIKSAAAGVGDLVNIFKKPSTDQIDEEKKIGGGAGQAVTELGEASRAGKERNDIRDPFFKLGGSSSFKNFLVPNAETKYGGALKLDLFKDDFFKDAGNIASVFGGSKDIGVATDKYLNYEKQKNPYMSRMGYEEGMDRGEIDAYNKQVDDYNNQLNSYFNQVKSSITSSKGSYIGTPTGSPQPKSTKESVIAPMRNQSVAPQMSLARPAPLQMSLNVQSIASSPLMSIARGPQMSMARPSAPQMSVNRPSSPQMSMARPSSPQMSVARPSQSSSRPSAPQMSVAPRPAVSTPAKANMSTNRGPVVAPKPVAKPQMSVARPAMSVAKPQMSVNRPSAPKPQSKPSNNVFKKVVNVIKNIFRR